MVSDDGDSIGDNMEDIVRGFVSGEFLEREVDCRIVDLRAFESSSANPGKYPL